MNDFLDCITVDFKGSAEPEFTKKFIAVPDPQPIFDSLIEIRDKTNIHVEITDLIVPQVGDNLDYAKKLSKFVLDEFGPEIPIHFLRFHPDYKMMDYESTPIKTLEIRSIVKFWAVANKINPTIDRDKKYDSIFRGPLESSKYPKGICTLANPKKYPPPRSPNSPEVRLNSETNSGEIVAVIALSKVEIK